MRILQTPLAAVTLEHLEELVRARATETSELEFKGKLPSKSPEDRWITHGDGIGEKARNEILAEIVAFANSEGGTLILGLHETRETPRRADRLQPLPRCEDLARRLFDAAQEVVEPRLSVLKVKAICHGGSDGFVVMRVARSPLGPHRLCSTRDFYIRRGERTEVMTVREIKDLTLELARSGDRLEHEFSERDDRASELSHSLRTPPRPKGPSQLVPSLVVRATAVPLSPQRIADLTSRKDLWWQGNGFDVKMGIALAPCDHPANLFSRPAQIGLRSLALRPDQERPSLARLLTDTGVAEFVLVHPFRWDTSDRPNSSPRLYLTWMIGLLVGTIAQVHRLRTVMAWDAVDYGLEIKIYSDVPLLLRIERAYEPTHLGKIDDRWSLKLPRYQLCARDTYEALVNEMVGDLVNAAGSESRLTCEVPWDELLL